MEDQSSQNQEEHQNDIHLDKRKAAWSVDRANDAGTRTVRRSTHGGSIGRWKDGCQYRV